MDYDMDLIEDVIEDLKDSDTDTLVLFVLYTRNCPVLKTRMQKEALIYNKTYSLGKVHEAYYFGGYSDDIDESYSTLSDTGMISNTNKGMTLTNFGRAVVHQMVIENADSRTNERMQLLEKSIGLIDDRILVAITYKLFPDLAEESTIMGSIKPLIQTITLNGRRLEEWTADEFIECIRTGTVLKPGRSYA